MREIVIDAARLAERESAQRYLREVMWFPDWYGGNLDALHDMLGEMSGVRLVFTHPEAFCEKYGYAKRVLKVALDCAAENPGLAVETREDDLEI